MWISARPASSPGEPARATSCTTPSWSTTPRYGAGLGWEGPDGSSLVVFRLVQPHKWIPCVVLYPLHAGRFLCPSWVHGPLCQAPWQAHRAAVCPPCFLCFICLFPHGAHAQPEGVSFPWMLSCGVPLFIKQAPLSYLCLCRPHPVRT